jgi:hypothetical protein
MHKVSQSIYQLGQSKILIRALAIMQYSLSRYATFRQVTDFGTQDRRAFLKAVYIRWMNVHKNARCESNSAADFRLVDVGIASSLAPSVCGIYDSPTESWVLSIAPGCGSIKDFGA